MKIKSPAQLGLLLVQFETMQVRLTLLVIFKTSSEGRSRSPEALLDVIDL